MTIYFYSASTSGFYTPDINPIMPTDAVEITEECYQSLLEGQSNGKQIFADAQGYPILMIPVTPPTTSDQNKVTALRLLSNTDWATISDVASSTNNLYLGNQSEFITYRNIIRTIAVYPPAGDIVWPTPPIAVWVRDAN